MIKIFTYKYFTASLLLLILFWGPDLGAFAQTQELSMHDLLRIRIEDGGVPLKISARIKFMFPSQFNVYLHDTPSKELFGKSRRDFSSVCIRIEKPVELAEYLLKGHPDWLPDKIRATLAGSDFTARTIKLDDPVNIHILYWTVWVENDDRIYFGPDIYDRDAAVDKAIQALPPSSLR